MNGASQATAAAPIHPGEAEDSRESFAEEPRTPQATPSEQAGPEEVAASASGTEETGIAEADENAPRTWEGLDERQTLDTSEGETVYLLQGRNGSRIRVSASAHQLLSLRSSGVTSEAIAEALQDAGQEISAEELERRYQELCQEIDRIESQENDNPMGFWFRIRLLPEPVVVAIAERLKVAFRPKFVAVGLGIILAGLVSVFMLPPPQEFSSRGFWTGYGLLLVSVLIHEFGHASACAYYGARPSDIGATLYLIYPALYSDVSAAWKLTRGQRVVVDLAGSYFQFMVGTFYMVCYALTGSQCYRVGYLMILGSLVFSLNPVFRFDGYWVVADALGVTNLGRQPGRVLGYLVKRLRGKPADPLPWSAKITSTLAVYSVLSFTVWGVFLWMMGPRIWRMVSVLPGKVRGYMAGSPDVTLGSLLMSTAMAVLMCFILWRVARSMILRPLGQLVGRLQARYRRSRPPEGDEAQSPEAASQEGSEPPALQEAADPQPATPPPAKPKEAVS